MQKVPEHPNRFARIGATVSMVGALIWLQWPIDFKEMGPGAIILFVGSFITWAAIELVGTSEDRRIRNNILVKDVEKINYLLKLIDRDQFYVLKNQAIETIMKSSLYDGISELLLYQEIDLVPFHDSELERLYREFCKDSKHFYSDLFNLYTKNGTGSMSWRSDQNQWIDDAVYEKVMAKIDQLNVQASNLANKWQKFLNKSNEKLKDASLAISNYIA